MSILDTPEVAFAAAAVREAALLARDVQAKLVSRSIAKDDRSPVTVADFAAQALIARRLAESFPDAVLVGEESAEPLRHEQGQSTLKEVTSFVRTRIPSASDRDVLEWIDRGQGDPPADFWTLDPVDGTKGFLRHDQYAVALAYIAEGRVEIGALGCPELADPRRSGPPGTLAVAVRDGGCWKSSFVDETPSFAQVRVTKCSSPKSARLLRSVESGHTDTDAVDRLVREIGTQAAAVAMDSQAKYAVLAAGHAEILVRLISPSRPDYREKIWDQAAGSLIVQEAGGRVTDLDGKDLDFAHGRTLSQNRGILATNGLLHGAALDALRRIGA